MWRNLGVQLAASTQGRRSLGPIRTKLCEEFALACGDGRPPRFIKSLGRADLLILDDFGLEPLDPPSTSSIPIPAAESGPMSSALLCSQPKPFWRSSPTPIGMGSGYACGTRAGFFRATSGPPTRAQRRTFRPVMGKRIYAISLHVSMVGADFGPLHW
jgi:hypothetical protein